MAKQLTTRGTVAAGMDFMYVFMYFAGGCTGVLLAANAITVIPVVFYFTVALFLLNASLEKVKMITDPIKWYEHTECVE